MFAIDQPYTVALIASVIISLSMAVAVLLLKRNLGVYAFALLKASIGLWALTSLFEVCSLHFQTKVCAYSLKYLFIVMVPIAWFIFGLYYSNRLRELKRIQIVLMAVIPAITVFMVITNRHHHWMFTSLEVVESHTYLFVVRQFGPWFWVHAGYSYLLLFLGFFFMAKHLIDSPSPYRWQVATLLVGGLTPWVANMVFTFKLMPYSYLDLTPFAFTISGLAFMIGMVRFQLLDVVPIAQDVVIENIDDSIIVLDNAYRILNLNPGARRLADTRQLKIIGTHAEKVFSWWAKLGLDNDKIAGTELAILDIYIDDRQRLLRPKKLPLYCHNRIAGLLVTLHDVTDTLLAKEALRTSEERFRSLSENAPVIIFALEPGGAISYLNPAFEKILGHQRQKILGQQFTDLISKPDRKACLQTFDQLVRSENSVAERNITFHHKAGTKRIFNTSMAANFDARGNFTGIIGMAKDITEEHELQHRLFQSQKMEAIGTLAGGIAHDFNNLLMGMQANLSLMHLDQNITPSLKEKVTRVEDQIKSGATLTRQLLGYARKGKYVITTVHLNRLIEETLTVVQRTNKAIGIQSLLSDDPVLIKADKGQIELVLLNLFVNAVDAMPHGGRLTVSTRHVTKDDIQINGNRKIHFCELMIADTGIGMDAATRKRIFEPFFTTKDVGRGTGLGLASVYGVVKNHGGQIHVESTKGEGTLFTVYLPATREQIEKKAPFHDWTLPAGNHKILLVEDEPLIRKYSLEMIQSLDLSALSAQNGKEAIDIYHKHHDQIDLVILDMIMPGMDGLSVYKALHQIDPNVRIIITSGYATDERFEEILSQGVNECLKKPYTLKELADKIATVLNVEPVELRNVAAESV